MSTAQAERLFSTDDVADLTGATFRQLDYWRRHGWLTPTHDSKGSGYWVRYTTADVERVRRAVERIAWGLTPAAAWRTEDPGPCPPPP